MTSKLDKIFHKAAGTITGAVGGAIAHVATTKIRRKGQRALAQAKILREARQTKGVSLRGMTEKDRIFRVQMTAAAIRAENEFKRKKRVAKRKKR